MSDSINLTESNELTLECSDCHVTQSSDKFSNKSRKMISRVPDSKIKCIKCTKLAEQKMLSDLRNCMFSNGNKTKSRGGPVPDGNNRHVARHHNDISLKHETELISGSTDNIMFLTDLGTINTELSRIGEGKLRSEGDAGIMVLDLHDTLDLFLNNKNTLKSLADIKEKFALVVALSFVGKKDGPGSTRNQARKDIQELISLGVIDFGMFVFQRGPAKGWMCDTLSKAYGNKGIYFSDDSDDHLESVKSTISDSRLLDIHQSNPRFPSNLYKWIFKCSNSSIVI